MPYIDSNTRTSKTITTEQHKPLGRLPLLHGVYVGFVKDAEDVQRNGRLRVWIPDFGNAPDEEGGWTIVNYCSPFAGATNVDLNSKNTQIFEGTQTSYGMWMIPPDINNQVLVVFAGGDSAKGFWLGCLYNQYMNNMIPGMAASASNYQYPGEVIPVAEYNKKDIKVTQPDRTIKPYEATKFKGVGNQGLIKDQSRGVTTSSARRESPSKVFGILTPGPAIDEDAPPASIRRKGGSSFIMDDKTSSEYVQIATKSGAQVRLDETNGYVYVINRDGTSWIQLDQLGNVDVFAGGSISLRAQQDVNIRADRNLNFEAGQNVFIKAAMDSVPATKAFTYDVNNIPKESAVPYNQYVGEGAGVGGNIVMQAFNNWHSTTENNTFITNKVGNLSVSVNASMALTTVTGTQEYSSNKGIKMTTLASFDLAVKNELRVGVLGETSLTSVGKLAICTDDTLNLSADKDFVIKSVTGKVSSSSALTTIIKSDTDLSYIAPIIGLVGITSTESMSSPLYIGPTPSGTGVPPVPVPPVEPLKPNPVLSALTSAKAEVKPKNAKTNVLYTFADEAKFIRESESVETTVSRFPTLEPCPEHQGFKPGTVTTTFVPLNETDKTYAGSAGPGNPNAATPPASTSPTAENTEVAADSSADNAEFKDVNTSALDCQIKYHEGEKNKSYVDSEGHLTGGVGHLMRADEIAKYPAGTPIPQEQVDKWYKEDLASATKVAQSQYSGVWDDLSDTRKRALIDLSYNLGPSKLAKFTKFKAAMNKGDYDTAAAELKDSKWYGQVGRRGNNVVSMIGNNVDSTGCGSK